MFQTDRPTAAALSALMILQFVMLTALYAGTPPHPPAATPIFGMAPFLAAALAAAAAALVLGGGRVGQGLALLAAALAAVSFGPQKYLDPQIGAIWPAVLGGQVAIATIAIRLVPALRRGTA
ncbi:MAG: hypothetical protein AAF390_17920 [Pseudomonadota bacterium]